MGAERKKVCVITGATSGIGYAIAKRLAAKNLELILIARDKEKGNSIVEQLQRETGNNAITFYSADLGSQHQIREAASRIKSKHAVIDILINNAGVVTSKYELTEDHIEKQFAVNHLAYFLLTHLLYPNIALSENGRIINIGSGSHWMGKIHFDNIHLTDEYNPLKAYGQSKLANLLFTYELHRVKRDPQVSVYCVSPGLVKTDIGVKHANPFHALIWKLRRFSGQSPEQASETPVYLASDTQVAYSSGLYWKNCKPTSSSPSSENAADALRLWKLSESMCGINRYFDK